MQRPKQSAVDVFRGTLLCLPWTSGVGAWASVRYTIVCLSVSHPRHPAPMHNALILACGMCSNVVLRWFGDSLLIRVLHSKSARSPCCSIHTYSLMFNAMSVRAQLRHVVLRSFSHIHIDTLASPNVLALTLALTFMFVTTCTTRIPRRCNREWHTGRLQVSQSGVSPHARNV